MKALTKLFLLVVLLAGCSGRGAPIEGGGGTAVPQGDTSVDGEELPGRLLFVREGVIWQWRGREARPLIGDGAAYQPVFSPDGERIAYVTRGQGYSDLLLADSSGAPLAQLTYNGSEDPPGSIERVYTSTWAFYPTWAPDGTRIVAVGQPAPPEGDPPAEYNLGLYMLPVGSGARTQIYADPAGQCGRSSFAPDGSSIVFVHTADTADGQQQLYRIDLASDTSIPLAGAPMPSYDPAFTPDGRWIAFVAREGDRTAIFALPAVGGATPLRLTNLEAARAPAFAPGGKMLAFLAIAPGEGGFDLWVADLSQGEAGGLQVGEPRQITHGLNLDADSGLSWAP